VVLAIITGLALASTANALPWAEIGDAGELPATAQVPVGIGTLTSISGMIDNGADADMFLISVTGIWMFSATTVGLTDLDTQLFLFGSTGLGVLANDDTGGGGLQSTLPATALSAGIYYLAISTLLLTMMRSPLVISLFSSTPHLLMSSRRPVLMAGRGLAAGVVWVARHRAREVDAGSTRSR